MAARTIIDLAEKPQTQSIEAIKALLSWRGRAADPLPQFVELGEGDNRLVLVLSNKRDAYYTTTARECSCPAHNWHPEMRCKHQRAHFPEQATTKPVAIIMERKPFKPFLEDEVVAAEAAATSPSFEMVDCLPDPTARDLAYHSIKLDRDLWPMCEA
jgi:hypothetical protein